MVTKKPQKTPKIFCCENCDFNTSHKGLWNRHLLTPKYQNGNKW